MKINENCCKIQSTLGIESSSDASKGKGKQQVFADLAVFKNKRWALKPLEEFATGMIRDPSKDFKVEMKRVGIEMCCLIEF